MPLYDFHCPACTADFERVVKLAELDYAQVCPCCGNTAQRKVSAPAVFGDYEAYDCPITGDRIEGKAAHEANLRKHGCRIIEPGETAAAQKRRQDAEDRLMRNFGETVDREIALMPSQKREKLAAEMSGGLNVAVTRNSPTN